MSCQDLLILQSSSKIGQTTLIGVILVILLHFDLVLLL